MPIPAVTDLPAVATVEAPKTAARLALESQPSPDRMNVILAEDDLDIQLVARLALKRAGFIVKVVGNGQEALDAVKPAAARRDPARLDDARARRPRNLPAAQVRSRDRVDIPVIFLTAKSQEAEIQRGLSLGAAGYVTKPFDALTLGQHVKDIVAARSPSVTIRTRAFVVLWLITILVAGTIGFIIYSLNVAARHGRRAPAHRPRSSTCTARCGARWSSSSTISTTTR